MEKCNCFDVIFLDVTRKWLDDTKTTVELIYYNMIGQPIILAYVHTDDAAEEAKKHKDKYLDIMLNVIKNNVNKNQE